MEGGRGGRCREVGSSRVGPWRRPVVPAETTRLCSPPLPFNLLGSLLLLFLRLFRLLRRSKVGEGQGRRLARTALATRSRDPITRQRNSLSRLAGGLLPLLRGFPGLSLLLLGLRGRGRRRREGGGAWGTGQGVVGHRTGCQRGPVFPRGTIAHSSPDSSAGVIYATPPILSSARRARDRGRGNDPSRDRRASVGRSAAPDLRVTSMHSRFAE